MQGEVMKFLLGFILLLAGASQSNAASILLADFSSGGGVGNGTFEQSSYYSTSLSLFYAENDRFTLPRDGGLLSTDGPQIGQYVSTQEGQTPTYHFNAQTDADFTAFASRLSAGDTSFMVGESVLDINGSTITGSAARTSPWFSLDESVLFGSNITEIVMIVNEIDYGYHENDPFFSSTNSSHYYSAQWQIYGELTPVPVPAAIWLFGSGLIGLLGFRKTKKL